MSIRPFKIGAFLMCFVLGLPLPGSPADLRGDLKSLVEAERDFSKASEKKGIREAFLTYLADNAILFRPNAVNGRQYMTNQPEDTGKLTWTPIFADISAAGDMGYTTGPYEYRRPEAEGVGHGHYISVWKKQPNGKWRVVIDLGVVHPQIEGLPTDVSFPAVTVASFAAQDGEAARGSLLAADTAFSDLAVGQGVVAAYEAYAADEIRFYRMLEFPLNGKQAMRAALSGTAGRLTWKPSGGEAARSGDLGVTYGVTEFLPGNVQGVSPSQGSYMRVWRRYEAGWRVVVDVVIQLPQPMVQ